MTHRIFPIVALGVTAGAIYLFRNQIIGFFTGNNNPNISSSTVADNMTGASGATVQNGAETY